MVSLYVYAKVDYRDPAAYAKAIIQQGMIIRMAQKLGLDVQLEPDPCGIDAEIQGDPARMASLVAQLAHSPFRSGRFPVSVTHPHEQKEMEKIAAQYPGVIAEVIYDAPPTFAVKRA